MPEKQTKNTEQSEAIATLQPFVLIIVGTFTVLLLLAPFLPVLISNFVYSLSGEKPKIYWYLSRSAGFITLTILWVSMALGLGLTNKLARLWPGAPAAFAVHQYVSLLGLAFTAYHALVMMGDHYVDFSFPRLVTPFSIAFEPFWVGLGQVGFYIWVIVVASFYVRSHIGQKTWRVIHYLNFVTYMFGMLHGIFSGADAKYAWAQLYYWLSGASLLALLIYRVYQSAIKKKEKRLKPAQPSQRPQVAPQPAPASVTVAAQSAPSVSSPMQAAPSSNPAKAVVSASTVGVRANAPATQSAPSTPPPAQAAPTSKPVSVVAEPVMSAEPVNTKVNVPVAKSVSVPSTSPVVQPVPASIPVNVTVELVLPESLIGAHANVVSSQAVPEKPQMNTLSTQAMPEKREQVSAANEAASRTRPTRATDEPATTPVNNRIQSTSMPALRVTRNPRGVSRRPIQASASQHSETFLQIQGNALSMQGAKPPWRKVYIGGAQSKPHQKSKQTDTTRLFYWFQEGQLPRPDPSPAVE